MILNPKTYLIAGGTGLLGVRLTKMLLEQGHQVRILTRTPKEKNQYAWNPSVGTMDAAALQGVDAVINLAGASIADGRWTARRKRELINSRVQSAQTLFEAMQSASIRPSVYVSASAIGMYGDTGDTLLTETSLPADDSFMVECCQKWEQAAQKVASLSIRTAIIRIGVVMAGEGGALAEIARPIRLGVGTYFGDGQAWYSWIHIDDICRVFQWAADHTFVEGVYNAVAPHPERNKELTRICIQAMDARALLVPAPAFALRLVLGEMSAVVLNSNRVSAKKLIDAGFVFKYPNLEPALVEIFQKK